MAATIAALPVLVGTLLLVGLRWPAARAMPACASVTALAAIFYWKVSLSRVLAAIAESTAITFGVLLILFGALLLVEQLRAAGAVQRIERWLAQLTPDPRLQVLLVAWLLGSFFEGAAGFGTPAAITAPLLVALGFAPRLAVVLALVGDSVAVSFGAVGTPLLVGMARGLSDSSSASADAIEAIARRVSLNDVFAGSLVPTFLVLTLTFYGGGRQKLAAGLRAAPFALAVGIAHTVAAAVVVYTLGPELPSLLGPLLGLLVALVLLRRGWLVPRDGWHSQATGPVSAPARDCAAASMSIARALGPYGLLILLLALTRARALGIGALLGQFSVGWRDLFGTGIHAELQLLYSPSPIFVIVTLLTPVMFKGLHARSLAGSAQSALRKMQRAALPLLAAIISVRVFVHSGVNATGLAAMPITLAAVAADAAGPAWPVVAPWVGALGSFIAGSATFSNMLFAGLQHGVATLHGHGVHDILALQAMGAAAGNMTCIHNVVAASAIVGLARGEGEVIRRAAPAMAGYLFAGAVGWLFAR